MNCNSMDSSEGLAKRPPPPVYPKTRKRSTGNYVNVIVPAVNQEDIEKPRFKPVPLPRIKPSTSSQEANDVNHNSVDQVLIADDNSASDAAAHSAQHPTSTLSHYSSSSTIHDASCSTTAATLYVSANVAQEGTTVRDTLHEDDSTTAFTMASVGKVLLPLPVTDNSSSESEPESDDPLSDNDHKLGMEDPILAAPDEDDYEPSHGYMKPVSPLWLPPDDQPPPPMPETSPPPLTPTHKTQPLEELPSEPAPPPPPDHNACHSVYDPAARGTMSYLPDDDNYTTNATNDDVYTPMTPNRPLSMENQPRTVSIHSQPPPPPVHSPVPPGYLDMSGGSEKRKTPVKPPDIPKKSPIKPPDMLLPEKPKATHSMYTNSTVASHTIVVEPDVSEDIPSEHAPIPPIPIGGASPRQSTSRSGSVTNLDVLPPNQHHLSTSPGLPPKITFSKAESDLSDIPTEPPPRPPRFGSNRDIRDATDLSPDTVVPIVVRGNKPHHNLKPMGKQIYKSPNKARPPAPLPTDPDAPELPQKRLYNDDSNVQAKMDDLLNQEISKIEDPSLFEDEPLYQIYHTGALVRDMWQTKSLNRGETLTEEDDEIYVNASSAEIYEDLSRYRISDEANSSSERGDILQSDRLQDYIESGSLDEIMKTSNPMRRLWTNTKEVVDSGLLDRITNDERKLQMSLFEIITSEASYHKSLKILMGHFYNSRKLAPLLLEHHKKHLFSNVKRVYETSQRLMACLEDQWRKDCLLSVENICMILNSFCKNHFEVYVVYCANQTFQERTLTKLCENETFKATLHELENDPYCVNLPLQSFLSLPMQRVTRYPLLFDAIAQRVDERSLQFDTVKDTVEKLRSLVEKCNAKARMMASVENIALLEQSFDFRDMKKIALVSSSRFMVKQGCLRYIKNDNRFFKFARQKNVMNLFLFNDCLIIARKKDDKYIVVDYASRENIASRSLEAHERASYHIHNTQNIDNMFVMALLENHDKRNVEYIFSCDNLTEKTRWIEAVTSSADNEDNTERIYQEWDQPVVIVIKKYVAEDGDALWLNEGDVIRVSRKMADGWYEGQRESDNKCGWFPSDHTVEIVNTKHAKSKQLKKQYQNHLSQRHNNSIT